MTSALSESEQETMRPAWAAFLRLLEYEREEGPEKARQRLAGLRMVYLASRQEATLPCLREATGPAAGELAETRGVWALWMLRQEIGPLDWERIDLDGDAPVSWEHLAEILGRKASTDLAPMLDYWIGTDELPDYRLERATGRAAGDGFAVTVRIRNASTARFPVPVAIRTEEGARHQFSIPVAPQGRAEATYPVLTRPTQAAVDPSASLLMAAGPRSWMPISFKPSWWPFS